MVHWVWIGINNHSVTDNGCPATCLFDNPGSPTFAKTTGTFDFTFNTAGTYNYRCIVHPRDGRDDRGTGGGSINTDEYGIGGDEHRGDGHGDGERNADGDRRGDRTVAATGTAAVGTSTPAPATPAPRVVGRDRRRERLPATGAGAVATAGAMRGPAWHWRSAVAILAGRVASGMAPANAVRPRVGR